MDDRYRIAVAELKQETSTFNPAPTTLENFRVYRGSEMLDHFQGTRTEMAGFMDALQDRDVEFVPLLSADAVPGGRILDEIIRGFVKEIIECIEAAGDIHGVYLCLHGAMAGENETPFFDDFLS